MIRIVEKVLSMNKVQLEADWVINASDWPRRSTAHICLWIIEERAVCFSP